MLIAVADKLESTHIGNSFVFVFDHLFFDGMRVGSIDIV